MTKPTPDSNLDKFNNIVKKLDLDKAVEELGANNVVEAIGMIMTDIKADREEALAIVTSEAINDDIKEIKEALKEALKEQRKQNIQTAKDKIDQCFKDKLEIERENKDE